jgi:excisionase family DNA binding protein
MKGETMTGDKSFASGGADEMPDMMTIAEVAKYLKLHELTVRRLAREGELPAFKVGRQWRIKRDLLETWIADRSGKGAPD